MSPSTACPSRLALGIAAALGCAALPVPAIPPSSTQAGFARARLAPGLQRLHALPAHTATAGSVLSVANCDDAGPGSLRSTIATAGESDTIDLGNLPCSTISLTSGQIPIPQQDLVLQGPGKDALVIDAQASSRVFDLGHPYAQGSGIRIAGMTLANGRADHGGCINAAGDLLLDDVRIRDCRATATGTTAAMGGGVFTLGNLHLMGSIITGNRAIAAAGGASGGGLASLRYLLASDSELGANTVISSGGDAGGGGVVATGLDLVDCNVHHNTALAGSGIASGGGLLSLGSSDPTLAATVMARFTRGALHDNRAHSDASGSGGGGLQTGLIAGATTQGGGSLLTHTTASGNEAGSDCLDQCMVLGGAVAGFGGITLEQSALIDNRVVLGPTAVDGWAIGGALAILPGAPASAALTVQQSTLSANRAGAPGTAIGGAIATAGAPVHLAGVTIAFNQASTSAGGVMVNGNDSTFVSSIIADNQAPTAADVGSAGTPAIAGGDHNLIGAAAANIVLPVDTLHDDPQLLPLADNGGATRTHALHACSPALDRGIADGSTYDQRGAPWLRVHGSQADIGAYELQPAADRIFSADFDDHAC